MTKALREAGYAVGARRITSAGTLARSERLELIDGDLAEPETASGPNASDLSARDRVRRC